MILKKINNKKKKKKEKKNVTDQIGKNLLHVPPFFSNVYGKFSIYIGKNRENFLVVEKCPCYVIYYVIIYEKILFLFLTSNPHPPFVVKKKETKRDVNDDNKKNTQQHTYASWA